MESPPRSQWNLTLKNSAVIHGENRKFSHSVIPVFWLEGQVGLLWYSALALPSALRVNVIMTVLLCPLCSQPRFTNLESLRVSLVNAATQSISCPICSEVLIGLDKLTIHLFAHTLDQNQEKSHCMELKISKAETVQKETVVTMENISCGEQTEVEEAPRSQVEDLLREEDRLKESNASTVNMEDLSFLTSWENSFRMEDSKDTEETLAGKGPTPAEAATIVKEEGTELSEYMSDLLNKKLPILNFVFAMDTSEKQEEKGPPVQETEQFKCTTCDFSFQNSIVLSMHQELVHSKCKAAKDPPEGRSTLPGGEVLQGLVLPRYDCHLCSKSFKMKGSLLVHYRVAHLEVGHPESPGGTQNEGEERNFRCSICSKAFKKEQHLTQHIKTHEGKQWRCETCSKHFTTKYFLKKHQRLHTGEMPYSCQACNKTFTFQQSYHKHLLYHSDEKPHRCSQCGRAFKELSTLHNHQRIHSGEKPFACETCGKCFRQRVSYIVHQRIHTGVLPYQCTACKKKFRYKVSQRSHKCTAQPPGVVVRQPGDLIQRILEQRNEVLQCPR